MKTYEIDYSAPAAVIKKGLIDRYAIANVYKVKYHAAFVIHYIGTQDVIFGDAQQTETYCRNHGLCLIPKNNRARKYLSYIICK